MIFYYSSYGDNGNELVTIKHLRKACTRSVVAIQESCVTNVHRKKSTAWRDVAYTHPCVTA